MNLLILWWLFRLSAIVVLIATLISKCGPDKWFKWDGNFRVVAKEAPIIVRFIFYIYGFFLFCFFILLYVLYFPRISGS